MFHCFRRQFQAFAVSLHDNHPAAVFPNLKAYFTTGTIRTALDAVPYWNDIA